MVEELITYEVRAERADGWWILSVPQVPGALSQVRSLSSAEEHIREAIAFVAQVASDSFEVQVVPVLPEQLATEVATAQSASETYRQAQDHASASIRRAIAALSEAGLSGPEIARILGVTKQRISQLTQAS
jgi:predicted RNase H-like HicB family nuclease